MIDTGVYMIWNSVNDKVYVGGAYKSFEHRFRIHRRDLIARRHGNEHLQSAWNLYGSAAFGFLVIEECEPSICEEREQYWISALRATDRRFGYNKSPTAGSPLGTKHPPEYGAAIAERNRNMSEETRRKIGAKSKGRLKTKESRKKQSASMKKRWTDPKHRARVVAANTGRKASQETCDKISVALKGRKLSEEHRQKCRLGRLGSKWTDEQRAKFRKTMTGRKRPPEVVAKVAEANRGKIRSATWRANLSAGIRASRAAESPEERKRKYGSANVGISRRKGRSL